MKVFFTASLRGQTEFGKQYKSIFNELLALGFKHLDDEIFQLPTNYYDTMQKQGKQAFIDLYQRKIKAVQEADICIFEGSLPSLSIGYLIQKALDFNKPTIIFYFDTNIPEFISGIDEEKLIVRQYGEKNIKSVVQEAIDEARHIQDKRFNFFISPDLLNYLEKASKIEGLTKSTFIRNLILNHKKKHI